MKALCILFLSLAIASVSIASLAQTTVEDPKAKAAEIHQRAMSDVIYTQDELKALYYQNVQIINLLTEMRDSLREALSALTYEEEEIAEE